MVAQPVYLPPEPIVIEAKLAEKSLAHFIRQAWHVVEPFTPYVDNWHVGAVCEHLEAVVAGQITKLLINFPPRMMKSITCSVMFPAWVWLHRPESRFLYSSYAQALATDHSLATRRVIESDWYQERWGDRFALAGDANLKTKFENDKRGYRFSTSVGGTATGQGGNFVVCDDPHSVQHAESDAVRRFTLDWWDRTMSTRRNDPKRDALIIVMQRVHHEDLAGHVLAQGGYVHLNLPMEYEPTTVATPIGWRDPRTEPGELLAPQRIGQAELDDLKVRLGSRAYAGQYQQRPVPAEGAILKREWWQDFDPAAPRAYRWTVQVWDTAFKAKEHNDWSVCATWALADDGYFLLDLWRAKVEFPDLKRAVVDQHAKHRPDEVLIEDAASGQSLLQELEADTLLPIKPVRPDRDKVARAHSVSPVVEAGRVHLPRAAEWRADFVEEHAAFPAGPHDDQVDTTTMGLRRLIDKAESFLAAAPVSVPGPILSGPAPTDPTGFAEARRAAPSPWD